MGNCWPCWKRRRVRGGAPSHEAKQLVGQKEGSILHDVYSAGVTLERLEEVMGMAQYSEEVTGAVRAAVKRAVG